MLKRETHLGHLRTLLAEFPIVGLIGARQVGKTTLARQLAKTVEGPVTHFDLESSRDLGRLEDPEAVSPDPTSPRRRGHRDAGESSSSAPTWNGTSRISASGCQRPPCAGSGR